MSGSNYYELQKAIYEQLTGNTDLMALVNGVFDHVPQGANYPFVNIGKVVVGDLSNINKTIYEYQVNIELWSREAGHKQISEIMEIVYGALHNNAISIVGMELLSMLFTSTSITLESDGWTYHGIMRLRVIASIN